MAPAALSGCSLFASPCTPPHQHKHSTAESFWQTAASGTSFQRWWKECAARTPALCAVYSFLIMRVAFARRLPFAAHGAGFGAAKSWPISPSSSDSTGFFALSEFPHHFDLIAGKMNTVLARLQNKDWY